MPRCRICLKLPVARAGDVCGTCLPPAVLALAAPELSPAARRALAWRQNSSQNDSIPA